MPRIQVWTSMRSPRAAPPVDVGPRGFRTSGGKPSSFRICFMERPRLPFLGIYRPRRHTGHCRALLLGCHRQAPVGSSPAAARSERAAASRRRLSENCSQGGGHCQEAQYPDGTVQSPVSSPRPGSRPCCDPGTGATSPAGGNEGALAR